MMMEQEEESWDSGEFVTSRKYLESMQNRGRMSRRAMFSAPTGRKTCPDLTRSGIIG